MLCAHAEIVVAVRGVGRSQAAQELAQILEQQRLVFLDADGGSGVSRKDLHQAVVQASLADDGRKPAGDVDELNGGVGGQSQDARV